MKVAYLVSKPTIRLQDRDIQILKYIKESKFMNLHQIWIKFWPEAKTNRAAGMRMKELADNGLVTHVSIEFLRYSSVYYLTREGLKAAEGEGYFYEVGSRFIVKASDIVTSSFQHDSRLVDLRIKMESDNSIRLLNWTPETYIRADRNKYGLKSGLNDKLAVFRVPDALFTMECKYENEPTEPIQIMLEYEHQQYKSEKYAKYLSVWEENWSKYQKLIVCAHKERIPDLVKQCRAGLARIHKIDLNQGKTTLDDLVDAYMFIDFKTLMEKGITGTDLVTPAGKLRFMPI